MIWHKAKLGDLGRVITGKTPSRARTDYFGSDHPFVMPSDFGFMNYYCRDVAQGVSETGFEKHKNQTIPRDAALYVSEILSENAQSLLNPALQTSKLTP